MFKDLFKKFGRRTVVHLDYASTTPLAPEVVRAMEPYMRDVWENPSAIYEGGLRARAAIDGARTAIARALHIRAEGVLFTSGGTESNNLGIIGTVEALVSDGREYSTMEIVTTAIEHPSILRTCESLARRGVRVKYLPLSEDGRIDLSLFTKSLSKDTVLVTCAYVNSEIGTIQDVKRISRALRLWGKENDVTIPFHLDAAQAPLWLPCEMDALGIDLMTLDAGKCYGPKGVGVLAMKGAHRLAPILFGGGQEGGLRSGTENTPLIVGCAAALVRAFSSWESRSARVRALRDSMIEMLRKEIPGAVLNGSSAERVANNVNVSLPGIDSEYAVVTLDRHDIAASTKSACGGKGSEGSDVVRELTKDDARAMSTIRFTLGEETSTGDIARAVQVLKNHAFMMRSFSTRLNSK